MLASCQYHLGHLCGGWYSGGVIYILKNLSDTLRFGASIGAALKGGEVIELIGDVGAGKTTLVKGVAAGLVIDEDIQSPSFTLSREYEARDGLQLHHYDFYRLDEAGIMTHEIAESVADPTVVTVVEWAGTVEDVLPSDRIRVSLAPRAAADEREVNMECPESFRYIGEAV